MSRFSGGFSSFEPAPFFSLVGEIVLVRFLEPRMGGAGNESCILSQLQIAQPIEEMIQRLQQSLLFCVLRILSAQQIGADAGERDARGARLSGLRDDGDVFPSWIGKEQDQYLKVALGGIRLSSQQLVQPSPKRGVFSH